jgi:hypothetical protein
MLPQWGLGLGGVAALVAAALGFLTLRGVRSRTETPERAVRPANPDAETAGSRHVGV